MALGGPAQAGPPAKPPKAPQPKTARAAAKKHPKRTLVRPTPKSGKAQVRFDAAWASYPSARYVALSASACEAELGARTVAFTTVESAPGVLAPVRLDGPVNGVLYRTELPDHARAASPFEVYDCRLVLALYDFASMLKAHDIDEVRIFSAWRPPGPSWPADKLGRRHPGALAIDAKRFGKRLKDGETDKRWLDVERDFQGKLGAPPCGEEAPPPRVDSPEAREVRSIACEAADQHLFTAILTPNYNRAHHNHFHLELTPEVTWHLMR